jgi:hypothetical protein
MCIPTVCPFSWGAMESHGNRGQRVNIINIVLFQQRLLGEESLSERGNFDLTRPWELQQKHGIGSELCIANRHQHSKAYNEESWQETWIVVTQKDFLGQDTTDCLIWPLPPKKKLFLQWGEHQDSHHADIDDGNRIFTHSTATVSIEAFNHIFFYTCRIYEIYHCHYAGPD